MLIRNERGVITSISRLAEARRPTFIVDLGRAFIVADHAKRAIAPPMLILRERKDVPDALPNRRVGAGYAADLP